MCAAQDDQTLLLILDAWDAKLPSLHLQAILAMKFIWDSYQFVKKKNSLIERATCLLSNPLSSLVAHVGN